MANRDVTIKISDTRERERSSIGVDEVGRSMKPHVTWIVVADRGRALVFENVGPGKGMRRAAMPQKDSPNR